MPLFEYRCPQCDLLFGVARPAERAAEDAACPRDGASAQRVSEDKTTLVSRHAPPERLPRPPDAWTHFGHTHAPGEASHSHLLWSGPAETQDPRTGL
jgi:putative FmdB family regulatory protein